VIVISGDGRQMHMLNETASLVWRCVDGVTSVDRIVERVCEEYEVDEGTASRDVEKAIEMMREKNLVRISDTG